MRTAQPRTMTVSQLIEHIKADNLEEVVAFQLVGAGYLQIKTKDCEEYETLLKDSGDMPMIFNGKKQALKYVDDLVKETIASIGNVQYQKPEHIEGISTTRKVY